MNLPTIQQEWESFWKALHKGAQYGKPVSALQQRVECKRCFIAGAASFFDIVHKLSSLPEEEGAKKLQEYYNELYEISNEVTHPPYDENI